jgi:hypothetical protein
VASAEVHSEASGITSPLWARRSHRSRGVNIELFVRTRKLRPFSASSATKRSAPGTMMPSCTSTPSMSHSQLCGVALFGMHPVWGTGPCALSPGQPDPALMLG